MDLVSSLLILFLALGQDYSDTSVRPFHRDETSLTFNTLSMVSTSIAGHWEKTAIENTATQNPNTYTLFMCDFTCALQLSAICFVASLVLHPAGAAS